MVRAMGAGGSERQVATLARYLNRTNFQPHVACFQETGWRIDDLRQSRIPILTLPLTGFVNFSCLRSIRMLGQYVREHNIQLVHSFDFPANIFNMASRLARIPVVLSSQRSFRTLIPPKYRAAVRLSDRVVDGIVVNCKAVQRHLIEQHSVPEHKIHLCYNTLDRTRFYPHGRQRPEELQGATLVIGAICVLRPVKSIATLLDAFARVSRNYSRLRLVIVGNGEQRKFLEDRAQELGVASDCLFRDATDTVGEWLRAIDIFVLPSLSEAFSNALMEAMACGCCVIASRVGGSEELVRHRETGLLFEPGSVASLTEALSALIDDSCLRGALAQKASEWVSRELSPERTVARMEEIYENLLQSKSL